MKETEASIYKPQGDTHTVQVKQVMFAYYEHLTQSGLNQSLYKSVMACNGV